MGIYVSMVHMVVPRRKLTWIYLIKDINMMYFILGNARSITKMRSVKELSNFEGVRGKKSQPLRGVNTKLS